VWGKSDKIDFREHGDGFFRREEKLLNKGGAVPPAPANGTTRGNPRGKKKKKTRKKRGPDPPIEGPKKPTTRGNRVVSRKV